MSYSISQAYKDVEQILKRPINSFDFNTINSWFSNYEVDYIEFAFNQIKTMPNIYSTNFINTWLYRNYDFYKGVKNSLLANTSITPTQDTTQDTQQETKTDDNMCNEVGWEGCSKDEQAYLIAMFKHSLYPDEFPTPTKPN